MMRTLVTLLLFFVSASALAQSQPNPPWGPATSSNGTYNINWNAQGSATLLQEKVGASATWTTINTSLYQFSTSYYVTFSNKPAGQYYYRLYVAIATQHGVSWTGSNQILVTVGGGGGGGGGPPVVSQDRMSNQLGYTYSARIGDINGDARQDVFIQRTAGGVSGNGTLERVILRRLADGTFTPDVPTSAQIATASAWPLSNTKIELHDPNVDGFADLLLPELGSAISGAGSQLVFSSGQLGVAASPKVLPTGPGTKYAKFMNDIALWVDDPGYFERNAPIYYYPVYGWVYVCDYYEYWNCWWELWLVGYQGYYDFSSWDPDAVNMRYQFPVSNGVIQTTINPGTTEARNIGTYFQNVFGVQALRGILGNNCYDYQYDPITGLPCIDFSLILLISMPTEKGDCRLLTLGEKNLTALEQVHIENVHEVRVCNKAFPVPGGRGRLMVPGDGHIYVGASVNFPWREDYSNITLVGAGQFSYLLHELVHVFQVRNGNCGRACMLWNKTQATATGGYKYWPIPPGKTFQRHNIEQQAEMVQDRFRTSPPYAYLGVDRDENDGADYFSLMTFIPILAGDWVVN